ncbi:MAG: hypothetical protein GXO43_03845 [Crenarchaeota archaeon]|nr:hypothetical protein [Thermoproteota archaeon]
MPVDVEIDDLRPAQDLINTLLTMSETRLSGYEGPLANSAETTTKTAVVIIASALAKAVEEVSTSDAKEVGINIADLQQIIQKVTSTTSSSSGGTSSQG